MKTTMKLVLALTGCLTLPTLAQDASPPPSRWNIRFDIGGSIPKDPTLSDIGGPISSGGKMDLSAGMQFDFAVGYRLRPWLTLEAELGTTFNEIDSVGDWSYPDSSLGQLSIMANLMFEYPRWRFKPFVGLGAGGVYSTVTFGSYYYYYWSDSDGYGSDFVPAVQVIAGARYEFSPSWSVGVTYRFLATGDQEWEVDWWNGADFHFGVNSVGIHSICLVFTGSF